MPHDGEGQNPLVQPRVVRALKNRPRLVDMGFREEMLDNMEAEIIQRRTTDTVAHRISSEVAESVSNAGKPVVRNRVRDRMDKANEGILNRL